MKVAQCYQKPGHSCLGPLGHYCNVEPKEPCRPKERGNQQKGGQIKSWRIFINFFAVLQVEENIKVRRSSSIVLEYCRQILFHFYNLLLMLSCYAKPLACKHCLNFLGCGLHILKCLNNIMECEKSLFLQNVLFLFFWGCGGFVSRPESLFLTLDKLYCFVWILRGGGLWDNGEGSIWFENIISGSPYWLCYFWPVANYEI